MLSIAEVGVAIPWVVPEYWCMSVFSRCSLNRVFYTDSNEVLFSAVSGGSSASFWCSSSMVLTRASRVRNGRKSEGQQAVTSEEVR